MAQFSTSGRSPIDRYFSIPPHNENRQTSSVVLGAYSYAEGANLSLGSESATNILIGRYSSIAGGLTIIAGLNHIYKNSVTTYPFDVLLDEFVSYGKTYLVNEINHPRQLDNHYQVIIGNDVWIGQGSTVIGGVKIGSGAIIGSNSTVAKDIPPYAIAVGNPAQVIKYRFDEETIKKFMAVKWWNWEIDKVCANVHKMYDVEKFLAEHYNPALENISYDILGKEIEKYRAEGRKVYSFIADFRSPYPLWRRVLRGMLMSNLKDAVLIFFLGIGATDKDLEEVTNFPQTMEKIVNIPIIEIIPPINGQVFSANTLRQSTHFITTCDMITLECIDCLYDTDVKIISALDDGIFDGEPLVDWSKI